MRHTWVDAALQSHHRIIYCGLAVCSIVGRSLPFCQAAIAGSRSRALGRSWQKSMWILFVLSSNSICLILELVHLSLHVHQNVLEKVYGLPYFKNHHQPLYPRSKSPKFIQSLFLQMQLLFNVCRRLRWQTSQACSWLKYLPYGSGSCLHRSL
jgi:hypothetical protein